MNRQWLLQQTTKVSSLLNNTTRELVNAKPVQAYQYAERAEAEIKEVIDRLRAECPSCGGGMEWEYQVGAPDYYVGTCTVCGADFDKAIRSEDG